MNTIRTCNIEAGFPSLDEARRSVIEEIRRAKREGVRVLKVIHGYGSSGKGGTLCHGLRKSFALRKKEGVIKDYFAGSSGPGPASAAATFSASARTIVSRRWKWRRAHPWAC